MLSGPGRWTLPAFCYLCLLTNTYGGKGRHVILFALQIGYWEKEQFFCPVFAGPQTVATYSFVIL
jgi:hypothetical protein